MKKILLGVFLILFSLFTVTVYQYFKFDDGKLHITICNVGQGDSIFIRTPDGSDVLIDGGPDDKVLNCLASHMPFWDRTIEVMIMTHPDADHSTGLTYVLKRYKVLSFNTQRVPGTTATYHDLMSILAEKKMTARYLYAGDKFSEGNNLVFTAVWPTPKAIAQGMADAGDKNLSLNEFCVIELLTYGNFKALFTGDAGSDVEDQIAPVVGKIDFLKVPHHGSATGMDAGFLSIIRPSLAAISVGLNNRYGHPAPISLELLKNAGVKTLRTDQDGEIDVVSDGNSFSYSLN